MIEIWKGTKTIDFTGKFKVTSIVSIFLVLSSLLLLFNKMKYGVDFAGGAEVQVKFDHSRSYRRITRTT